MKKHHSKSTHARHLLGNLNHRNECSPAEILMSGGRHGREHHAIGGAAGNAGMQNPKSNLYGSKSPGMADMERRSSGIPGRPQYKKGGHVNRRRHADGGPAQGNPSDLASVIQMMQNKANPPSGNPATALKRGGRAKHREHHFLGALAGMLAPMAVQGLGKLFGFAEGGNVNTKPLKNAYRHAACGGELKRAMGGAAKVRKGMMEDFK